MTSDTYVLSSSCSHFGSDYIGVGNGVPLRIKAAVVTLCTRLPVFNLHGILHVSSLLNIYFLIVHSVGDNDSTSSQHLKIKSHHSQDRKHHKEHKNASGSTNQFWSAPEGKGTDTGNPLWPCFDSWKREENENWKNLFLTFFVCFKLEMQNEKTVFFSFLFFLLHLPSVLSFSHFQDATVNFVLM